MQIAVALTISTGSCNDTSGLQILASAPFPPTASTLCPSLSSTIALKTSPEARTYYPKTCGSTTVPKAISPFLGLSGNNPLIEVTLVYSLCIAAVVAVALAVILSFVISKAVYARMRQVKVGQLRIMMSGSSTNRLT